jgi:hypothetical protein
MKSIDMYNEKCHLIGEMILEGEMANKKHLLEAKLGYCKNKLLNLFNLINISVFSSKLNGI